ncbi:hypothetical protein [Nocardioides bigeumensis]|uniref:Glycosyltransferase n=1 Tax=Nocardioides bigeumensis TaxID=433657 RepID=A0ABN2YYM5_9ACTN
MSLPRVLERAARPTLLLAQPGLADRAALPEGVRLESLGDPVAGADEERWGCVVVAARDRAALRAGLEAPPAVGRTRALVTWLAEATTPLVPRVRPEWPDPVELDAHLTDDGGAVTRLRLAGVAPTQELLARLRVDAGSRGTAASGGLVVARDDDPDAKVPADVLRGGAPADDPSPVTGRAAVVVRGAGPVAAEVTVDEGVLNPTGFRRDWERLVVELSADVLHGPVTESTVAALRDAQGVRVPGSATAYDVAALAMAGVPLLASTPPEGLAPALAALLTAEVDLSDAVAREVHSVHLRRAAAAGHSLLAERTRLGAAAGVRVAGLPTVSVVLATRRRALLDFAVTQVAKQRGADIELVLAPHGFDLDAELRAALRSRLGEIPLVVVPSPRSARFGDVLHAAAQAASGEVVLKMDDDDWYGPDVATDLLWARRTSGAELVGMPAELVYLDQLGITVRRRAVVERSAQVVAGGTMLIGRDDLRAVGGFRSVVKYVDAQLLAGVRLAGGRVHRTQGLGYLLRRTATGHTWATELGYFLSRRTVAAQWRGFRPSPLHEVGPDEWPARPAAVS